MAHPPRKYRWPIRVCLAGCILSCVAFLASGWYAAYFVHQRGFVFREIGVCGGGVFLGTIDTSSLSPRSQQVPAGWRFEPNTKGWAFLRTFPYPRRVVWSADAMAFCIPLWTPFLCFAAAIGVMWWRRRARPAIGFCSGCRYDLTGNVSGVCPECGRLISASDMRAWKPTPADDRLSS